MTDLRVKLQNGVVGQVAQRTVDWFSVAVLLVVIAACLYANLFTLPHTPILLGGDQTYFWTDAQRMLFGERPYRDFFQFTPPGTDLFYFALFKWFGPRIWVTNMVVLVLGVGLCWVCFSVSRQIMAAASAVLATQLFLILVYAKLLNATHHWFSMLIIMCAVRIAMPDMNSARVAIVGILLGVASFFTQTHAAVAVLACAMFLTLQRSRERQPLRLLFQRLALLVLGFSVAWLVCNFRFLVMVGIKQLWYDQVTFVWRYMVHAPEGALLGLPEMPTWRRLPAVSQYFVVYALLVVTYPWSLWQCWLRRHDHEFVDWEKVTLLSLMGSALCVEVGFSLNWLRIFAVSMPAIVLVTGLIEKRYRPARYGMRLTWAGVVCLALLQIWSKHSHPYILAELPAGRAALSAAAHEKFGWVMHHTRPGEFFFEPLAPSMYLPLGLRSPVFVEGLGTREPTLPEFVDRTIRQFEAKPVRYVLWSPHLDRPAPGQATADHLAPFRAFLHEHYARVWMFSDHDEIWGRR